MQPLYNSHPWDSIKVAVIAMKVTVLPKHAHDVTRWLSRDNLSLFALLTNRHVKNWFTHLLDRSQTTSCLDSKLFLNTYEPKISIYDIILANDHFIVQPPSMTLTFNVPEQMFQITLPLVKEYNCAKLFRNSCINVQELLNLWPFLSFDLQVWPWPLSNLNKCFKLHF